MRQTISYLQRSFQGPPLELPIHRDEACHSQIIRPLGFPETSSIVLSGTGASSPEKNEAGQYSAILYPVEQAVRDYAEARTSDHGGTLNRNDSDYRT